MKLHWYKLKGILKIHKMKAENKIKQQPINELAKSRQHLAELEVSENQHKGTKEALINNDERASQTKTRIFHPWAGLIVSLGLATCIVFVVGHLLGSSWLNVQKIESNKFSVLDHEEHDHETGDMSMAETFSPQQGLHDKATSAVVHMPDPKAVTFKAGRVVIQVGAFREKANAELLFRKLVEKGYNAYLDKGIVKNLGLFYWVRLRGYANERVARTTIGRLKKEEGLNDSFALTVTGGDERSLTPALQ